MLQEAMRERSILAAVAVKPAIRDRGGETQKLVQSSNACVSNLGND